MPRYFKNKIYTDQDRENIGTYQAPLIEARQKTTIDTKYNGDFYAWSRDEIEKNKMLFKKAASNSQKKKGTL